jgi:predicted nucleotidyltransferase
MEIIKDVRRWGNSAGILLPREWMGKQVQVVLIDRTLDIKKEVFNILVDYLEDIAGIYLCGSYARGEEEKDSDIDVIVISNNLRKEIISGKYKISILPLESIKKALEKNPILIFPRLIEAKAILNENLLKVLKNFKFNKNSFKEHIEETRRIIKINEGLLNIDKVEKREFLDSNEIIYSLVLRLKGIYLINCILKKEIYKKKNFLKLIEKILGNSVTLEFYKIYRHYRDDKKIYEKNKIKLGSVIELMNLLKEEINKLE